MESALIKKRNNNDYNLLTEKWMSNIREGFYTVSVRHLFSSCNKSSSQRIPGFPGALEGCLGVIFVPINCVEKTRIFFKLFKHMFKRGRQKLPLVFGRLKTAFEMRSFERQPQLGNSR